jgi:hypothetical protein
MNRDRDPTRPGAVVEEQLRLSRALTKAAPQATRAEIEGLQLQLQPLPRATIEAAVEHLRTLPDATVAVLKQELQAVREAAAEAMPAPSVTPAAPAPATEPLASLGEQVGALRAAVEGLREDVRQLREALAGRLPAA